MTRTTRTEATRTALRTLRASFVARDPAGVLVVYFDADEARDGFAQATEQGLEARELETPRWGNASFVITCN